MIENGLEQSGISISCAMYILVFFLTQWTLKLVHGSMKQEWKKDMSLSPEKVAKMKIGWRWAAEGFMLAVMAGCGAFLFALMSAKEPDEALVRDLGATGGIAGVICLLLEIITVTKEQEKRRTHSHLTQPVPASTEDLVDGCSWWYVAANFLITTFNTIL